VTADTPRPGNHSQRISERLWPADMTPGGMTPGGPRRAPVLHIETVGGTEIIVPRQEAADAPADDDGQAAELAAVSELARATAELAVDTSELCRDEFERLGGQLTTALELLKRLSELSAVAAVRLGELDARITAAEAATRPCPRCGCLPTAVSRDGRFLGVRHACGHVPPPPRPTPIRLDGCTCGGIGDTGAHRPGCQWAPS
jgi:hypothetical protein